MRKINFILIFFMVILGFIITPNFTKATDDLTFEFQKEILYNSSSFEYNNSFNLAPTSYYSGHYNGTYSFENEIDYTSNTDIDFVDNKSGNGLVQIEPIIDNHAKVLSIEGVSSTTRITHNFSNIKDSTIEFWLMVNSVDTWFFHIRENSTTIIFLQVSSGGTFRYQDSIGYTSVLSYETQHWYHMKFNLESDNTFDWYINGTEVASNVDCFNDMNLGIDNHYFQASIGSDELFLDAIGYSWHDFYTGDSYDISTETVEPVDICWDGTYFWLLSWDGLVYKYNSDWVYQEFYFETDDPEPEVPIYTSICFDGTYFWIMGDNLGNLYKYSYVGIYQNEYIDLQELFDGQPLALTFDGTFLWIFDDWVDEVHKITTSGIYTNISFETVVLADSYGIAYDGSYFYLTNTNDNLVYQHQSNIGYTGQSAEVIYDGNDEIYGLEYYNGYLWIVDYDSKRILKCEFNDPYYQINDNLIPSLVIDTSLLQISAYELTFKDINQIHNVGESNPESWTFDESGGGTVQIDYDWTSAVVYPTTTFFTDRTVSFTAKNTDYCFMNRSSIDIVAEQFITITFGINITAMLPDAGDWFHIEFYESDDSSIITHLRFNRNFGLGIGLSYWDDGINLITNQLQFDTYYDFSVLLNFELGINVIDIWENGIYFGQFIIPFSDTFLGTKTLGDIYCKMNSDTSGFDNIAYIDYIGIFNNGTTQVEKDDSYGYIEIKLNNEWNFKRHNLLFFRGTGNLQIYDFQPVNNLDYIPESATSHILDSFRQHNNTIITNNIYDLTQIITDYNQLIIYTTQNMSFNYINIEGVALNQSTNQYWLELEHSNVNINESYFYVDSSNKLQFNHISDDSDLEYIQASFDINDVSSDNYSIAYKSFIQNNAYGFFRVNYTDTSNILQLKNAHTTTRFLLEQNRVIRSIIILITDRDNNVISGLTTGNVFDIKLLDIISVQTSLITQSLINMMIPLIIILVPSLGFSSRFGKQVIIPFFILLSLILTATGMIPTWLFFVILFSSLVMILFKSKDLGD